MTLTLERTRTYSESEVRRFLCEYQRWALGARPQSREDVLGSKPPPASEAPWTRTATIKADVSRALQSLPFDDVQIMFMHLCLGQSAWRYSAKEISWREKVGDWWGLTAGEVTAVTDRVIESVTEILNGSQP